LGFFFSQLQKGRIEEGGWERERERDKQEVER